MLPNMNSLLPVRFALNVTKHCSQRRDAEYCLVREKSQHGNNGLMPPPLELMCLQKLMQPHNLDEERQGKAVER